MSNKRDGYATITGPGGQKEFDTMGCIHCGRHWALRASDGPSDPGGFCRLCMHPICPTCVGKECAPFERKLFQYENRQDLFRQMELI
jgi:ferredoxin